MQTYHPHRHWLPVVVVVDMMSCRLWAIITVGLAAIGCQSAMAMRCLAGCEPSSLMEGEAQCTGTRGKEGKAVDNLSMLTSYCYIRYTCIRLQEISKVGINLSKCTHPQYADKLLRDY